MPSQSPAKRTHVLHGVLTLAFSTGGAAPPASPLQPTFNFYFGNLHSHTSFSDASGTPRAAYRLAQDEGKLEFIAINEHNHRAVGPKRDDRAPCHPQRWYRRGRSRITGLRHSTILPLTGGDTISSSLPDFKNRIRTSGQLRSGTNRCPEKAGARSTWQ